MREITNCQEMDDFIDENRELCGEVASELGHLKFVLNCISGKNEGELTFGDLDRANETLKKIMGINAIVGVSEERW